MFVLISLRKESLLNLQVMKCKTLHTRKSAIVYKRLYIGHLASHSKMPFMVGMCYAKYGNNSLLESGFALSL